MCTRSDLRLYALLWCVSLLSPCAVAECLAVDNSRSSELSAEQLLQEALHREVYGMQAERNRLLSHASKMQPELPQPKWHQGMVSFRGQWLTVAEVAQICGNDRRLSSYYRQRERWDDDLAGNLALASWCQDNHFSQQRRAHLERVLDIVPDHVGARASLGYRMVGGRWQTEAELQSDRQRRQAERLAVARWRPQVEAIGKLLRDRKMERRQLAKIRLARLDDPEVIPVMERFLAADSAAAGSLVVDWLADRGGQSATLALVRQAVLAPWPAVRQQASECLAELDPVRFVPAMLDEMYTPVSTQTVWAPSRNGRLVFRQLFQREGREQRDELILQREYIRQRAAAADSRVSWMNALVDSWSLATGWQTGVARQNQQAAVLNDRIVAALRIATGQAFSADPQAWWQWWYEQEDVTLQGDKQTRRIQRGDQVTLVDFTPQRQQGLQGGVQARLTPQGRRGECLAAGTPVWTIGGQRAVEQIMVGDLVLSQDVETGELNYKPVLRTTERAAEPLLQIEVEAETFVTTRGHLFWVSGDAWLKADDLQPGAPLHAVDGTRLVSAVRAGSEAPTYNLEVADFHTYFVGASCLLSHDVTARRATDAVVPGLHDR